MGINAKMDAPNAPIPPVPVELPGPAPCQAPQLTILRLPQSVYIPMIVPARRISNEKCTLNPACLAG